MVTFVFFSGRCNDVLLACLLREWEVCLARE